MTLSEEELIPLGCLHCITIAPKGRLSPQNRILGIWDHAGIMEEAADAGFWLRWKVEGGGRLRETAALSAHKVGMGL
jgi:hypothetical protein